MNFFLDLPVNYSLIKVRGNWEHYEEKKKRYLLQNADMSLSGFLLSRYGRSTAVITLYRMHSRRLVLWVGNISGLRGSGLRLMMMANWLLLGSMPARPFSLYTYSFLPTSFPHLTTSILPSATTPHPFSLRPLDISYYIDNIVCELKLNIEILEATTINHIYIIHFKECAFYCNHY